VVVVGRERWLVGQLKKNGVNDGFFLLNFHSDFSSIFARNSPLGNEKRTSSL
jgi:hypothetical protein